MINESASFEVVVSDKDMNKKNKIIKGIIHIHLLLQNGIKWLREKRKYS